MDTKKWDEIFNRSKIIAEQDEVLFSFRNIKFKNMPEELYIFFRLCEYQRNKLAVGLEPTRAFADSLQNYSNRHYGIPA